MEIINAVLAFDNMCVNRLQRLDKDRAWLAGSTILAVNVAKVRVTLPYSHQEGKPST